MSGFQELFGVIVSGRPLMTAWKALSPTKCIMDVASPGSIAEITFFMLPSTIIPPGYGAILYYTAPPSGEWEILGSVFLDKPSGMFRTGWPERSDMNIAGIQLGVELSPLETIQNLELTRSGFDDRLDYAKKVARDLYNYMSSFGQPSQQNMMLVPTNVFDKWLARFEGKFRQDPNFLLKLKQGD